MAVLALSSAALISVLTTSACAKKVKAPVAMSPRIGSAESGIASWYGHPYHGRRAANGEVYDMDRLTAAHRTLPFETWVEVRNRSNDRSVTVRITDRGPFVNGRIIDLSRAAAEQIEMIGPGTAEVRITVIKPPRDTPAANFGVQVGAFRERDRAERIRAEHERGFGAARLIARPGSPSTWRVVVGRESSMEAATGLLNRIVAATGQPGFVVRLDENDPAVRTNP